MHPAALPDEMLWSQCELRQVRRSGPGGQRRNKVSTGIVLRHKPTGIEAEATERRSQAENRRVALFRLRLNLALKVRSVGGGEADRRRKPSELWRRRVRAGRISISPTHRHFPALLAEALDTIAALGTDVAQAAAGLQVSSSQLVRLLAKEPRALALVNQWRAEQGLRALRV